MLQEIHYLRVLLRNVLLREFGQLDELGNYLLFVIAVGAVD